MNTLQSSLALGPKALGIFPKLQKLAKKMYLRMVNALLHDLLKVVYHHSPLKTVLGLFLHAKNSFRPNTLTAND